MSASERSSDSIADEQAAQPVGSSSGGAPNAPSRESAEATGNRRGRSGKKDGIVDPVFEDPTLEWFRAHPASPFVSAGVGCGLITAFVLRDMRYEGRRESLPVVEALDSAVLLGGVLYGILLLTTVFMYLAWRRRYWAITETYVLEKTGVFSTSRTKAAISSIDAVDVTRNLMAKIFGFSVVTVRLPDSETIEFRYVRVAEGRRLRKQLLEAMEAGAHAATDGSEASAGVDEPPQQQPQDENPEVLEGSSSTDKEELRWVGGRPRRERVDFLALDRDDAIVYNLPVARSVKAQAWRAGVNAMIVAGALLILAIPIAVFLTHLDVSISQYAGETIASLASINAVLIVIGGLYAAFRAATRYYASKVRVVPGAFGISRGLLKEFSSTLYTTRVHWIDISQPFAWRWPGYWRLRVRTVSVIDYDDDEDEAEEDNAKPNELVLPVATLEEIGHILELLAPYTDIDPVDAVSIAGRKHSLTATTSRRARFFNPFVHGHEGYVLTDNVLYARTGRWTTSLVAIPLKNIQHTAMAQGGVQRLVGLGDIEVNGALSAGSCVIENLDDEVADALFVQLRECTRTPQYREKATVLGVSGEPPATSV